MSTVWPNVRRRPLAARKNMVPGGSQGVMPKDASRALDRGARSSCGCGADRPATDAFSMIYSLRIRRYVAYYRGWCQAFGEHEVEEGRAESANSIQWLFGEDRVGLILPEDTRKRFLKELVRRKGTESSIVFSPAGAEIVVNRAVCSVLKGNIEAGAGRLLALARQSKELHMFLTHHLYYSPGTRIVTFSATKPLGIMYKEIDPLILGVHSRLRIKT